MKKILFWSWFIPSFGLAQTPHSLLWKITKDGSENQSYLFGTIHTNEEALNTFDENWWNAFNSCETLAGEVNFTDQSEIMSSLAVAMMKDRTLKDLYSPEEFERVLKFISSHLDPMSAMMIGQMKPFYIMAAIMEMPTKEGPYKEVMDLRLQNIAKEKGKQIVGLESVKEQATSIDAISIEEQAKLLLEFVDNGMEEEKGKLEESYQKQNLDELAKAQLEFDVSANVMTALLDNRNDRFLSKLIPFLEDGDVFCAVGALHLTGDSGLIAQLKKMGYVIEPVSFSLGKK